MAKRQIQPAMKEPKAKPAKTLIEILHFAGIGENNLLSLFSDDAVMKQQCIRASHHNQKTKERLKYEAQRMKNREVNLNLEGLRISTEFKRLSVEGIDLDKALKSEQEAIKEYQLAAVGVCFDNLHIHMENSGNSQMINTYLKKKFPEVLAELGLTIPEEKPEILVPDKKIILPGDKDFNGQ